MSKGLWNNPCSYFLDAMSRININRSAINISPTKNTSKSIKSIPASYIYQIMHNNDFLYNDSIKLQLRLVSVKIPLVFFTYRHQRKIS